MKKSYWKVSYLECFGVMSLYEEVEYFSAWTKWGVYNQFHKKYGDNLPVGYTDRSNFLNFKRFCEMVTRVSKEEYEEGL